MLLVGMNFVFLSIASWNVYNHNSVNFGLLYFEFACSVVCVQFTLGIVITPGAAVIAVSGV